MSCIFLDYFSNISSIRLLLFSYLSYFILSVNIILSLFNPFSFLEFYFNFTCHPAMSFLLFSPLKDFCIFLSNSVILCISYIYIQNLSAGQKEK